MSVAPELAGYIAEHGRWLYHCTAADNLAVILRDGLVPSGSESQWDTSVLRPDNVYLCDEQAAIDDLAGHGGDWGDAVLAVDLTMLAPDLLECDDDYWRGELRDAGVTDLSAAAIRRSRPDLDSLPTVISALRDGGTCSYRGVIPPAALRVAYVPDRGDLELDEPLRRLFTDGLYGSGLTSQAVMRKIGGSATWLEQQRRRLGV